MRRTLVVGLTLTLVSSLGVGSADALSCAARNETQQQADQRRFENADAVFEGTVRKIFPADARDGDGMSNRVPGRTIYVFSIHKSFKGELGRVERVLATFGHLPTYGEGDGPQLVFVKRTPRQTHPVDGGPTPRWSAGACGSARMLAKGEKPRFERSPAHGGPQAPPVSGTPL